MEQVTITYRDARDSEIRKLRIPHEWKDRAKTLFWPSEVLRIDYRGKTLFEVATK